MLKKDTGKQFIIKIVLNLILIKFDYSENFLAIFLFQKISIKKYFHYNSFKTNFPELVIQILF